MVYKPSQYMYMLLCDVDYAAAQRLAVTGPPGSGSPAEVMEAAGITAPHIAAAARRLIAHT
jgi:hypothetical protein